jgi:hypothetical protein
MKIFGGPNERLALFIATMVVGVICICVGLRYL